LISGAPDQLKGPKEPAVQSLKISLFYQAHRWEKNSRKLKANQPSNMG
jgi:hypothetical protein